MLSDFISEAGFTPPFHLVAIDGRGTVTVSRVEDDGNAKQISTSNPATRRMVSPISMTVIGQDGGKTAVITIERPKPRLQ